MSGLGTIDAPPVAGEIPHLTDAWHKARKNYALFSGILLAWVLIGIELTNEPIENVNIRLLVPEAAPLVFIALILYFAFRTTVEWFQCDERRRAMMASRVDFGSSHVLAVLAIGAYGIQRLLAVQIGAYIVSENVPLVSFSMMIGAVAAGTLHRAMYQWSSREYHQARKWTWPLLALLFAVVSIQWVAVMGARWGRLTVGVSVTIGFLVASALFRRMERGRWI